MAFVVPLISVCTVGPCCFRVELLFVAVGPVCCRVELLSVAVGPFCFRVELLFINVVGDVDAHVVCSVRMWPLYWSVSPSSSWLIKAAVVEK